MAGNLRTTARWDTAPDPDTRKRKRIVEEELLQKVTIKNDLIEFHPIILSSRQDRARFYINLSYSRVSPPWKEILQKSRDPWFSDDPALRQISNPARHGPRDNFLPNLVKPHAQIRIWPVPPTDTEYHIRRAAANDRLTKLFDEWPAYNRMAFPVPIRRKRQSSVDQSRTISRGTLINLAQGQSRRKSSSSSNSSRSDVKRDICAVPKSRKKKNRWKDAVKEVQLLLRAARMQLPKELPRAELRIYVSSTPDLQEEREFLEEVVYPKLQELCEKIGLNCHVVDMRRGAGVLNNDMKTWDLIQHELRQCRHLSIGPYFIMLLGHVLDDDNLPGFLDKSVYEEIRETMIKENIVGVEAFDDVYRLDSNRIPPVYIKQPIRSVEEYKSAEEVERVLFNALSLAVSLITDKRPNDEHSKVDFYKWAAVVKEVEEGLLRCYTPRTDTMCFMMDLDQAKDVATDNSTPIQRLRHNVFQHYKQYASLANLVNFKSGKKSVAYLRSISDTIESGVRSLLKLHIRHKGYDVTQQLTEGSDILQHVRVALSEAENTSMYTDILSEVKDIVQRKDTSPKVILIWGQSGTGKTAVASQVAVSSVVWQPDLKVLFRCLGITLRSSSLFRVLESVVKQLNFLFMLNIEISSELSLQQIVSVFCDTLKAVSAKSNGCCRFLLILDQIELLPDMDSQYLLHILNSLTDGITLVLTLRTPSEMFNILKSHKTVYAVTTKYMSEPEVRIHLTENLRDVDRVVTSDQLLSGLNALPNDVTPLHAQMLTHIIQLWPSHTLTELKPFSDRPDKDFIVFIESLENELGKTFTRYALSFLACAKHGLADQEIFHLLSKDSDLLNEIKEEERESVSVVDGFPYQYQISRLIIMLGRFVMSLHVEGEAVYQITARPLVDAISLKYLNDSFFFTVHSRLANFFMFIRRGLLLSSKDISEQRHKHLLKYHWRTLRCVPYHLCHSSADTDYVWLKLKEKVFFNFAWLVNEIYAGCYNELLDDITYALDNVSLDPDIQYLQQMLLSIRQTVIYNPLSLAAIFASQNSEAPENESDSVLTVVNEARVWLKQVHLQALVPVSYTPDKTNRLMVKENCLHGVTNLKPIKGTDMLLIQRMSNLSVLDMLKGGEVILAIVSKDIISVHLLNEEHVVVLTTDDSSKFYVDIFSLNENKHVKTVPLGISDILWFDIKSLTTSYFASSSSIRCLDLERRSVTNVLTRKIPWEVSCISASKPEKIFAVTMGETTKIEATSLLSITETKSVSLTHEPANRHCHPLLSTKDGRFIIFVADRQAVVIDQFLYKIKSTYSYNGLPVVNAELSKSHEHVFLAYANGSVTCHVLHSGIQSMTTQIKPKPQSKTSFGIHDRSKNEGQEISQDDGHAVNITTLVTSEDDHFLICGTNLGHVYVIHVPTGIQLVDVTTQQDVIKQTVYLTSKRHFQHLITVDASETARHWNLRPLFKQARKILQDFITDEDLLNEEKTKLDLNKYYATYEIKKDNRMFLNGPDIKGFFKVPTMDIFADLVNLDPAFGVQNDWEATGTIADICDHLLALVCASELGNVILTVSKDFRLAKWNLQNGSLMWSKRLQSQGKAMHEIGSVYYDQAVMLVQQSRVGDDYGISVIYTGEDNHKSMSRDNVTSYWTSADRTHVMLMCQDLAQPSGTRLYLWDLVNTKEEMCECQHPMSSLHREKGNLYLTSFSPRLKSSVQMVILGDEVTKAQFNSSRIQTSLYPRELHFHSTSDTGVVYTGANSDNRFDMNDECLRSSTKHSIPKEKVHEPDSVALSVDELQTLSNKVTSCQETLSNKVTSCQETSNMKPGSPQNDNNCRCNNITNSTDASLVKPVLKNVKTYLYWAEVSTGHFKSEDTTENNDTIKTRLSDNSQSPFLSKVSSPSYKRRSDVTIQQNTTMSLKRTSTGAMNENNEEFAAEKESNAFSNVNHFNAVIPLEVNCLCFVGEQDILVGTSSKHLLMLTLPSFHPIYALGQKGPKRGDDITETFLEEALTPHKEAITYVMTSDDLKVLISSDPCLVCLWDAQTRTLTMKIELSMDQKISHLVVSKDAIVIAMATNSRTIRIWTPLERREIASYRTMFDIDDLQMTCDCRKVIVRGMGPEKTIILEIFDILNIDDILMHVTSRKESQLQQRREDLANERMINKHQNETWRMSSSLNVIEEI